MSPSRLVARATELLRSIGPSVVAFSGGVDSTVLLALAVNSLGVEHVVAATVHGDVHTDDELESARNLALALGARHVVLQSRELEIPGFVRNSPERCYLCRSASYELLWDLARSEGARCVVDGTNADDESDYRPGLRAAKELGVRSPLAEAGWDKRSIRAFAREQGLPNSDLPATPCLASRFPYGEEITAAKIRMVEKAERRLRELGFVAVRVRHHGDVARVELLGEDIPKAADPSVRSAIVGYLLELGYVYVALDLRGFRSGSLNEVLGPVRPA